MRSFPPPCEEGVGVVNNYLSRSDTRICLPSKFIAPPDEGIHSGATVSGSNESWTVRGLQTVETVAALWTVGRPGQAPVSPANVNTYEYRVRAF